MKANIRIRVILWVAAWSNKNQTKSYKVNGITMCVSQIQIKFTVESPYIHCIYMKHQFPARKNVKLTRPNYLEYYIIIIPYS